MAAAGVSPDAGTAVVLYAAGSSDSAAVATIEATLAEHGAPEGWGPWTVAALDGGQALEAALAALPSQVERTVSVSFMVAEGILRDRMARRVPAGGDPPGGRGAR